MRRFIVGFMVVREGQKHGDILFATDSVSIMAAWVVMGFRVFDYQRGRQVFNIADHIPQGKKP